MAAAISLRTMRIYQPRIDICPFKSLKKSYQLFCKLRILSDTIERIRYDLPHFFFKRHQVLIENCFLLYGKNSIKILLNHSINPKKNKAKKEANFVATTFFFIVGKKNDILSLQCLVF